MPGMRLLTLLAAAAFCTPALAADKATDLTLNIVKFDPPDGSNLKAGDSVTMTVDWHYRRPAQPLQVWVIPSAPDSVHGGYSSAADETSPGQGDLKRSVQVITSRLDAVDLVASADGHEIYRRRVPVHYTFAPNPELEAKRKDGQGSSIIGVTFDPPSPARLAPGKEVVVHIGYDAKSAHGLRPLVMPMTDCESRYNGFAGKVDGRGSFDQSFTVDEPCALRQVQVKLYNDGNVAIVTKIVDVDLRYAR